MFYIWTMNYSILLNLFSSAIFLCDKVQRITVKNLSFLCRIQGWVKDIFFSGEWIPSILVLDLLLLLVKDPAHPPPLVAPPPPPPLAVPPLPLHQVAPPPLPTLAVPPLRPIFLVPAPPLQYLWGETHLSVIVLLSPGLYPPPLNLMLQFFFPTPLTPILHSLLPPFLHDPLPWVNLCCVVPLSSQHLRIVRKGWREDRDRILIKFLTFPTRLLLFLQVRCFIEEFENSPQTRMYL